MTEKKKEEVKLTYEEKLVKNIESLEAELKKAEANYHQITGALGVSKGLLEEYKKSKE